MADLEIPDFPEEELGPAMRKCTPLERRFVVACVTIGMGNWQKAAGMAGYKGKPETLRVTGYRTSQRQHVREAILEVAAANLAAHAIQAQATVLEIMGDDRADKKTRLRAAEMVMDRVGMHGKTEHKVQVEHELGNRASMIAMLKMKLEQNPELRHSLPEPILKLVAAEPLKQIEHEAAPPLHTLIDPELADLI